MRVGNTPPSNDSPFQAADGGTPMPPELFNDVNALYFLIDGFLGINLKTATGETLQMGAQMFASLVNNLEAYYKANPPAAGSLDATLNGYLTAGGSSSLATLCANIGAAASANPPTIDTADLQALESQFNNPNSNFSMMYNMLNADPSQSYSYWHQTINYNPQGFDPTLNTLLSNFNKYAYSEYQAIIDDAGDPAQQKLDAQTLANRMLDLYTEATNHVSGSDTNFGCLLIDSLFNQLVPNPDGGSPVTILSIIKGMAAGTESVSDFMTLLSSGSGGDNFFAILQQSIQSLTGSQGIWHPRIVNPDSDF